MKSSPWPVILPTPGLELGQGNVVLGRTIQEVISSVSLGNVQYKLGLSFYRKFTGKIGSVNSGKYKNFSLLKL